MSRPLTTQSDDDRAIRAVVARCEAAWNASDSVAWAACMAEDVNFTSVLGDRYQGREIVERGHRHIFDTIYKDSRMTFTVEGVRFIRPDVALAFVHQQLISRLPPSAVASTARQMKISDAMHETQARATLMLAKNGGQWHVVAFHNTTVASTVPNRA